MNENTKLKSLKSNSADIARLLLSEDFLENQFVNMSQWTHVADWLLVAGGISKVELDREVLDSYGYMYCRPVFEYEQDLNEVQAAMVTQLAKFSFLWGSLETVINIISPQSAPKRPGKINAACYYLKQHLPTSTTFYLYDKFLERLEKLIQHVPEYSDLTREFNLQPHLDNRGLGIFVVYKIRNRFAHGALSLPDAGGNIQNNPDKMIIHTSSHIVLLTIQMLISAFLQNCPFEVSLDPLENEESEKIDILYLLNTILR